MLPSCCSKHQRYVSSSKCSPSCTGLFHLEPVLPFAIDPSSQGGAAPIPLRVRSARRLPRDKFQCGRNCRRHREGRGILLCTPSRWTHTTCQVMPRKHSEYKLVTKIWHCLTPNQTFRYHADHYTGYVAEVTYEGVAHFPEHHPHPGYGHGGHGPAWGLIFLNDFARLIFITQI